MFGGPITLSIMWLCHAAHYFKEGLQPNANEGCNRCASLAWLVSSFQEWANTMARRPSSVRLFVCKLLSKSLLLAGKWPDRHQTCTRWTPGQHASRVCSRSRSRSKVIWYTHFLGFLEWATPSLTVWFYVLLQLLVVAAIILSFKFYCKFNCKFYCSCDPSFRDICWPAFFIE